jgi:hypothetical protein
LNQREFHGISKTLIYLWGSLTSISDMKVEAQVEALLDKYETEFNNINNKELEEMLSA